MPEAFYLDLEVKDSYSKTFSISKSLLEILSLFSFEVQDTTIIYENISEIF